MGEFIGNAEIDQTPNMEEFVIPPDDIRQEMEYEKDLSDFLKRRMDDVMDGGME